MAGFSLPRHLTYLELECSKLPLLAALQVPNLQQLEVLAAGDTADDAQTLQQLAAMPSLREVSLRCSPFAAEHIPNSVAAWSSLRQLRSLEIQTCDHLR